MVVVHAAEAAHSLVAADPEARRAQVEEYVRRSHEETAPVDLHAVPREA